MAVLWKAVLSPDYVDGRFFRVTLLTDERFADASLVFGGLSRDQMAQNRKFLEPLPEGRRAPRRRRRSSSRRVCVRSPPSRPGADWCSKR